jgi:hypothetical protein
MIIYCHHPFRRYGSPRLPSAPGAPAANKMHILSEVTCTEDAVLEGKLHLTTETNDDQWPEKNKNGYLRISMIDQTI